MVLYSLQSIDNFGVSRMIVSTSISRVCRLDVNGFLDASEYMIAVVAYLKVTDELGETFLKFIMGKSKLEPMKCHTIPGSNCAQPVLLQS